MREARQHETVLASPACPPTCHPTGNFACLHVSRPRPRFFLPSCPNLVSVCTKRRIHAYDDRANPTLAPANISPRRLPYVAEKTPTHAIVFEPRSPWSQQGVYPACRPWLVSYRSPSTRPRFWAFPTLVNVEPVGGPVLPPPPPRRCQH